MEATNLVVKEGPIVLLLYNLCDLYLDENVLEVITDPTLLTSLLIAKCGRKTETAKAIQTLRKVRNSVVHKLDSHKAQVFQHCARYVTPSFSHNRATKVIYAWLNTSYLGRKQAIWEKSLQLCTEILSFFGEEIESGAHPPVISRKLKQWKELDKEGLIGKRIQIKDGNFRESTATFICWNGNNAKVSLDSGETKYLSLDRLIIIIE
jgi:hypothetical protein